MTTKGSFLRMGIVIGACHATAGTLAAAREVATLIPPDGGHSDSFGHSVAVEGDTAVVGSYLHHHGALNSGSAYVFSLDASRWLEVKELVPSDGAPWDHFGVAVALSGDTILVGAELADAPVDGAGAVYFFERDSGGPGNWGEVQRLSHPTGAWGHFGNAVSLDGDTAVVGAVGEGPESAGAVYVFQRGGVPPRWSLVKRIVASDLASHDQFGYSVALRGDTLVVGSNLDDDRGEASGSAYVFLRDAGGPGNWGEVKKLVASDEQPYDLFGSSVAIVGDALVVGAPHTDPPAPGAAYVFGREVGGAGNWGEVVKLVPSDRSVDDHFGEAVALSGDVALVTNRSEHGAAWVFERQAGGSNRWGQTARIVSVNTVPWDQFGMSVALSGRTALVGARAASAGVIRSGTATLFRDLGAPSLLRAKLSSLSPPTPVLAAIYPFDPGNPYTPVVVEALLPGVTLPTDPTSPLELYQLWQEGTRNLLQVKSPSGVTFDLR